MLLFVFIIYYIFICLRSTTPSCHFVALWTFFRRPSYPAVASCAATTGQQEPTFSLPPLGYREATRLKLHLEWRTHIKCIMTTTVVQWGSTEDDSSTVELECITRENKTVSPSCVKYYTKLKGFNTLLHLNTMVPTLLRHIFYKKMVGECHVCFLSRQCLVHID
jgi:hypothetical protein